MIYVDEAVFTRPNGKKRYAHMTADTLEELHSFAAQIGIKRHWFHRGSLYPHYDINEDQRTVAIANGAKAISSRELVGISKLLRKMRA